MKKLLILAITFMAAYHANGQFEWVHSPSSYNDYAFKMAKTKVGNYVLIHGWDNLYSHTRLTTIDGAGNIVYDSNNELISTSFYNVEEFMDIFETPDSSIAVSVYASALDTLSGIGSVFYAILKLNQQGEIVQDALVYGQYIDKAAAMSDGSYIILDFSSSKIARITANGSSIWEKYLPGYTCLDMYTTAADSIIITTAQGLLVLADDGNIANDYSAHVFDKIKADGQGGVIGVKEDSISLLSPGYGLLAGTRFSGDNIKDFAVQESTIAVLTSGNFVHRFDDSLSLLGSFQPLDDVQFKFIAIDDENIVLSGDETYGSTTDGLNSVASFIKTYSFAGNDAGLSNDVGVVGVVQGAESFITQNGTSSYNVFFEDVKVTVRNFGNNPVNTLYLRAKNFRSKKFTNLSLQPATEIELVWDSLEVYFSSNPTAQLFNLCIWTSHPDFRLDYDLSNDTYCTDFLVNDDEVLAQNSVAVYPNPTSGVLNVQINTLKPLDNTTISIIGADGRTMTKLMPSDAAYSFTIPVNDWSPGVYFLQILEAGAIVSAKRFVVVR